MKHTPNDGSFIGLGLAIQEQEKQRKRRERWNQFGCMLFCLGCAVVVGAALVI